MKFGFFPLGASKGAEHPYLVLDNGIIKAVHLIALCIVVLHLQEQSWYQHPSSPQ